VAAGRRIDKPGDERQVGSGPLPTIQRRSPEPTTVKAAASIFKAYDIRGVVGQTIDETFAEHLGRAFGSEARAAGERAVVVGRDGRLSGPGLAGALMRGLASTGLDVVDLGAVTTPMLYYVAATRGEHGCRSGIQVTGSHNPKDYNGFKMVMAGRAIYGDEIQVLRQRIEAERYTAGRGRIGMMDITAEYTASPGRRHPRCCGPSAARSTRCTRRSTATFRTTTPTRASPRTWPN
jgi:hypothetical protein